MDRNIITKKDIKKIEKLKEDNEVSSKKAFLDLQLPKETPQKDNVQKDDVVSAGQENITNKSPIDNYITKLLKYIPTEIIAVFITLDAIFRSTDPPDMIIYWLVFFALLIITPLYLWRIQKVIKPLQLGLSTFAFAIWVIAMGGPFSYLTFYKPYYGAVLAALSTLMIPMIDP